MSPLRYFAINPTRNDDPPLSLRLFVQALGIALLFGLLGVVHIQRTSPLHPPTSRGLFWEGQYDVDYDNRATGKRSNLGLPRLSLRALCRQPKILQQFIPSNLPLTFSNTSCPAFARPATREDPSYLVSWRIDPGGGEERPRTQRHTSMPAQCNCDLRTQESGPSCRYSNKIRQDIATNAADGCRILHTARIASNQQWKKRRLSRIVLDA